MVEQREDYPLLGTINPTDILKKRTIDWLFETGRMGCRKQEQIAEYTYETDFINAVKFAKSQLWSYTPNELQQIIETLYDDLDKEITAVDDQKELAEKNKILNKQKKAYEISIQVLEILFVVLQKSNISTEYKTLDIFDHEKMIKAIRTDKRIRFSALEIEDEE